MTQEPTRPVILQGGRLCGLPNQRVKTRLDATEYVDDDDGRVYVYQKHHVSDDGVDVFRIMGVRPRAMNAQPKKKARKKKKRATPPDKKD